MAARRGRPLAALTPQERDILIQLGKAFLDHTDGEVVIVSVASRSRPTLRRAVIKLMDRERRERDREREDAQAGV